MAAAASFHPLLADPLRRIHLMHCELDGEGWLTAAAAVVEAGIEESVCMVQAIADDGRNLYEVTLPPRLVRNGTRYKAFRVLMPCKPIS